MGPGVGSIAMSTSTTTTTVVPVDDSKKEWKASTVKEFLEIEDKDLQKYIFKVRSYITSSTVKKIDDDKKVGWFYIHENLKQNSSGKFYRVTKINEYIVYDKVTKKGRFSTSTISVLPKFLDYYFRFPEVMMKFIPKLTSTLIKKIVEGKICTLADLINYHRSYTFRDKNLSIKTIYRCMFNGYKDILSIFEDPNEVDWNSFKYDTLYSELLSCRPFKIRSTDKIDDIRRRYEDWNTIQSKKLALIRRTDISKSCCIPF